MTTTPETPLDPTAPAERPTAEKIENVRRLRGLNAVDVGLVYDAEVAAQNARCHVDPYNAALAAALHRRVDRALDMRNVTLGVAFDEVGGATRVASNDPEVRRLESPYRKVLIG